MLNFIIGIFFGIVLGAIAMAMMTTGGDCTKIEEAYYKGFEDGKATK